MWRWVSAPLAWNPGNHAGVRYALLNLLLELYRNVETMTPLTQFCAGMAERLYIWRLMEYRQMRVMSNGEHASLSVVVGGAAMIMALGRTC